MKCTPESFGGVQWNLAIKATHRCDDPNDKEVLNLVHTFMDKTYE